MRDLVFIPGSSCPVCPVALAAPNGDGVNLEVGLANGGVNAAADGTTEPRSQGQILGAHGNFVHDFLGFPNQGCAFQGFGHVAVFDEVGFFHPKVELARCANTAAAHLLAVNAFVDGGKQIVNGIITRRNIGVPHPGSGRKGVVLATTAAGSGVACANGTRAIGQEVFEDAFFDQEGALGGHPFVIHFNGAKGAGGQPFIPGGQTFVGNFFAFLVCKGGRALFDLGGFQQVATGFVEDHPAKFVGHDDGIGSGFHVIGIEHFASGFCNIFGGVGIVPLLQETGVAGIAQTAADGSAVGSIGAEQHRGDGLGQADIAGKGAIAGGHEDFLPVAEVVDAPGLDVAGGFGQGIAGGEQNLAHVLNGDHLVEPGGFLAEGAVVAQGFQVNFGDEGSGGGQL